MNDDIVLIDLFNEVYSIKKYRNGKIVIFDLKTKEKVDVKPILKRINKEKALGVSLANKNGKEINIKIFSNKIFKEIKKQIKNNITINLTSGFYNIQQYRNGNIIIFDIRKKERVETKPILLEINEEKRLGIDLRSKNKNLPNIKELGNKIFKEINILEKNSMIVEISSGVYRIEKYKNGSIGIFDIKKKEKVSSKKILRQINEEKKLGISLCNKRGETRKIKDLAEKILKALQS